VLATLDYSLRGGAFLPPEFGPLAGHFLIVGGVGEIDTPAYASTMDDAFAITPYASQPGSLWSSAIVATGFGRYNGGVLVVNQGSGQELFVSIDAGEVAVVDRKGAVVAKISGFAYPRGLLFTEIAGEPSLLIGDLGNEVIWKAGPEDIVPVP
jgi:hypothetical protein